MLKKIFSSKSKIEDKYVTIKSFFNQNSKIEESLIEKRIPPIDFKRVASSPAKTVDFIDFSGTESGRIDVLYKAIRLECLLVKSTTKRLFVFFSAAGRKNNATLYQRLGWCNELNGFCLYVEDPMYKKHAGLECGWYYGTEDESYLIYIEKIIKKITVANHIRNQDLYLIGSSSGGAAALYMANLIKGSIAYAYNPQITLDDWTDAPNFKEITQIDLKKKDILNRNSLTYIADNTESKFLISYNSGSTPDQKQFNGWLDCLGIEISDGLKIKNNIFFLIKEIREC